MAGLRDREAPTGEYRLREHPGVELLLLLMELQRVFHIMWETNTTIDLSLL